MEAKIQKCLSSFLAQHSLQDSISNIDDIVLSYLLSVLDLIGQGEVEDCFDLEDVTDMMNAYLPGFDQIHRSSVMEWMVCMAAQLKDSDQGDSNYKDDEPLPKEKGVDKKEMEQPLSHPKKTSFPKYEYSSMDSHKDHPSQETKVNGVEKDTKYTATKKNHLPADDDHADQPVETSDSRTVTSSQLHPKDQKSSCKRKKRYTSVSSQDSQEDSTKPQVEIQPDLDDCLVKNLLEMFPATCSVEAKHCLHVSNGDLNVAAQLVMDRQESGQAITDSKAKNGKNNRKSKKSSDIKLDDESVKLSVIEKYSFYDAEDEKRTHKPPPMKNEAKKLVRYRDGQIVSMKGERFSEIKKT